MVNFQKFLKKHSGDLKKLQNLSYEEGLKILELFPIRKLCDLYASQGSQEQISQLFNEWDSFIENPESFPHSKNHKVTIKLHKKKIYFLMKSLKRKKKKIPTYILEKY